MDLELLNQAEGVADIRDRVRQLRWFKATFKQHARLIAGRYGVSYAIDDGRLTEAFLNWGEAFSQNLSFSDLDRRDFITFAAGLLVRELLRSRPATSEEPAAADAAGTVASGESFPDASLSIVSAWPEGFLYTNYCLCVLRLVLEQEGVSLTLPMLADDLRIWWSYRENVGEDPSLAIPFLDLLIGNEPNWYSPASVVSRTAVRRALEKRIVPAVLASALA